MWFGCQLRYVVVAGGAVRGEFDGLDMGARLGISANNRRVSLAKDDPNVTARGQMGRRGLPTHLGAFRLVGMAMENGEGDGGGSLPNWIQCLKRKHDTYPRGVPSIMPLSGEV